MLTDLGLEKGLRRIQVITKIEINYISLQKKKT